MSNVKSNRTAKKEKIKEKCKRGFVKFAILTLGYAFFLMWISGMAQFYFPNIIGIGAGQYIDIQIGLIIVATSVYLILSTYFLKKK